MYYFALPEYDAVMQNFGAGDDLYLRAHFTHDSPEEKEMSFRNGTVFHVHDTLYGGVVGAYQVTRLDNTQLKGIIPNLAR